MLPSWHWTFCPSISISTIGVSRSDVGRDHAGLVFDVVHELIAVVLDERAHRHGGGITQRTDRAALDVVGHRVQQVDVFGAALATLDAIDHAPQPDRKSVV